MKKLQRRQQQNNTNEIHEKKSKKKLTNDSLSNQYIFDEEGENIGKSLRLFNQTENFFSFCRRQSIFFGTIDSTQYFQ